mmetsp:Transcript_680/g.1898  ORF Transcript_680/g.1898 Transcript_680/m.1898 type:complete len:207 (+) Transcript_680:877-1497(+)
MSTAPAPSPKRMHVFRSSQSTQRDSASAPMTRTFLYAPVCTNWDAVTTANRKPEHAAVRSNPTAFVAPIPEATIAASPKRSSGEDVASTTMSTSEAATPALSSAPMAAEMASAEMEPSGPRRCLLLMPVRFAIHSSEVSTMDSKSTFVLRASGAAAPTPAMRTPSIERPGTGPTADAEMLERASRPCRAGPARPHAAKSITPNAIA